MSVVVCFGLNNSRWDELVNYLGNQGLPAYDFLLEKKQYGLKRAMGKIIEATDKGLRSAVHPLSWEQLPVWQQADQNIKFLVFFARPEMCIAHKKDFDVEAWATEVKALLEFVHAHRQQTLLLDVEQCFNNPEILKSGVAAFLGTTLIATNNAELDSDSAPDLGAQIYTLASINAQYGAEALYNDLFVTANHIGDSVYQNSALRLKALAQSINTAFKYEKGLQESIRSMYVKRNKALLELNNKQLQQLSNVEEDASVTQQKLNNAVAQHQQELVLKEQELTRQHQDDLQAVIAEHHGNLQLIQEESQQKSNEIAMLDNALKLAPEIEKEKIQRLKDENNAALIQIHHLQEELERYYLEGPLFGGASGLAGSGEISALLRGGPGFPVMASAAEVEGQYSMDHYANLSIRLENLSLLDGRSYGHLSFKLVNNSGSPGIEFRPDGADEKDYVSWPDDMKDEHGHYLLILPDPLEDLQESQDRLWQSISAPDYLLALSVLKAVNDLWSKNQVNNLVELEPAQIRDWKKQGMACFEQIYNKKDSLRFSKVYVKEQYQADDYEHLWLGIEHLMVGNRYYPDYDFKIMASSLTDRDVFANHAALSFREIEGGIAPLRCWPATCVDEYGPELIYNLNLVKRNSHVDGAAELYEDDTLLLRELVDKLPVLVSEINKLDKHPDKGSYKKWLSLAEAMREAQKIAIKKQLGISRRIVGKLRAMIKR